MNKNYMEFKRECFPAPETESGYKTLIPGGSIPVREYDTAYHSTNHTERMTELTDMLEQGIKGLRQSEKYKHYLDVMARFHHYSPLNCLLIAIQCPGASYVAGYTDWQRKFYRQVRKGERSIGIFAPSPYKTKALADRLDLVTGQPVLDKDGGVIKEERETFHMAYKVVSCVDISQTDGEPLPEIAQRLNSSVNGYEDMMQALTSVSPVRIEYEDIKSGANGYFDSQSMFPCEWYSM